MYGILHGNILLFTDKTRDLKLFIHMRQHIGKDGIQRGLVSAIFYSGSKVGILRAVFKSSDDDVRPKKGVLPFADLRLNLGLDSLDHAVILCVVHKFFFQHGAHLFRGDVLSRFAHSVSSSGANRASSVQRIERCIHRNALSAKLAAQLFDHAVDSSLIFRRQLALVHLIAHGAVKGFRRYDLLRRFLMHASWLTNTHMTDYGPNSLRNAKGKREYCIKNVIMVYSS